MNGGRPYLSSCTWERKACVAQLGDEVVGSNPTLGWSFRNSTIHWKTSRKSLLLIISGNGIFLHLVDLPPIWPKAYGIVSFFIKCWPFLAENGWIFKKSWKWCYEPVKEYLVVIFERWVRIWRRRFNDILKIHRQTNLKHVYGPTLFSIRSSKEKSLFCLII